MPASKAQQKATNKYIAKAYDRINLTVPKGKKDIIQAHAEAQGQSVNGFINAAIDERMERGEIPNEASERPAAAQTSGESILTPDTIKKAQEAAQAAGETTPQFITRAVETQAQRDKLTLKMKGGPHSGD